MSTTSTALVRLLSMRRRVFARFVTALVVASAAGAAQAAELNRLFFTPEQRTAMEQRRTVNAPVVIEAELPPPRQELVTVNGQVTRSSGRTTTWINGVPQYNAIGSSDPTQVTVDSAEGRKRVKVGQTLDTARGNTSGALGNGEIRIHRKPAP
jgi:hypothetical protein